MQVKTYLGRGKIKELRHILGRSKSMNIFLVHGRNSYVLSGASESIDKQTVLHKVCHFDRVKPNPDMETIAEGIKLFRRGSYDAIIAIGGGSAIDTAKIIRVATDPKSLYDLIEGRWDAKKCSIPLIAIPTTAGSGSEATHFAVIYIGNKKYSLAKDFVAPTYAIVDPELTYNLPPRLSAISGVDALAQAVESLWSIHATRVSRPWSKKALRLVFKNIFKVVHSPDPRSRLAMMKGAHWSGKAINISFTTIGHALSYGLTAHYGIPHGHAVGMLLPEIIRYNADITSVTCVHPRGLRYVKNLLQDIYRSLGVSDSQSAAKKIRDLVSKIGLETKLSQLRIQPDMQLLLSAISQERLHNNPRTIDLEQAECIYREIM